MEERAVDKKIFQQNNFPIYCLEFLFSMFSLGRKVLLKEKIREQSTNDFMPTDLFIHTFSCKMTKSSSQFQIQGITLHLNACIYSFHCVRCLERFWKTKVLLYIKPLHQNWTWRNTLLWHSNYLAVVRRSLLYIVNNFILERGCEKMTLQCLLAYFSAAQWAVPHNLFQKEGNSLFWEPHV